MTEEILRGAFDHFLLCRAGYQAGVLTRREMNLACGCVESLCRGRFESMLERDAVLLAGLAFLAEGRGAA